MKYYRHKGCKKAAVPKTNTEYWLAKFQRSVERDEAEYQILKGKGWRVFVVWECELGKDAQYKLEELVREILMDDIFDY
jgi:DNA mismatch endonuclease, patch repair protein